MAKHLTEEQRYEIYAFIKAGFNQSKIAALLNVNRSTICREIKRNRNVQGHYSAPYAQNRYKWRMRARHHYCKDYIIWFGLIKGYLKRGLSPEQIVGRRLLKGQETISHETIYRMIWRDKERGGKLYTYLRRKGRKYQKRGHKYGFRNIEGRIDISERDPIVEKRIRAGDFEIDTIIGSDRTQHILTVVDRVTKQIRIRRLRPASMEETNRVLIQIIKELKDANYPVLTITSDNGAQFLQLSKIMEETGVSVYFAKPYHSWERGTNENTNGLVRQYLPKKTDFNLYSDADLQKIEDLLNTRPRKKLGFYTPNEYSKIITK